MQGDAGPDGPDGPTGSQGQTGATGGQGPKGETGGQVSQLSPCKQYMRGGGEGWGDSCHLRGGGGCGEYYN